MNQLKLEVETNTQGMRGRKTVIFYHRDRSSAKLRVSASPNQTTFKDSQKLLTTSLEGKNHEVESGVHELYGMFEKTPLPQKEIFESVERLNKDGYKVVIEKNKNGPAALCASKVTPGEPYVYKLFKMTKAQEQIMMMINKLKYPATVNDYNRAYIVKIARLRKELWLAYEEAAKNPEAVLKLT